MIIKEVFVFVVADRGPTDEGIPALQILDTAYPMVGADLARAESLYPHAEAVAEESKRKVVLRRFSDDGMKVLKSRGENPPKCTSAERDGEDILWCMLWEDHVGPHENWVHDGQRDEIDPQGRPYKSWGN